MIIKTNNKEDNLPSIDLSGDFECLPYDNGHLTSSGLQSLKDFIHLKQLDFDNCNFNNCNFDNCNFDYEIIPFIGEILHLKMLYLSNRSIYPTMKSNI